MAPLLNGWMMLRRWWGPLSAGLSFLLLMLLLAAIYNHQSQDGLAKMLAEHFKTPTIKWFLATLLVREVIPLSLFISLILWSLGLAWALLPFNLGFAWREGWTWMDGFVTTWSLILGLHLVLWWQVPTALWLLPGLSRLPFWIDFLCIFTLTLGPLFWVLGRSRRGWGPRLRTLAGWMLLAWLGAGVPLWIGRQVVRSQQEQHSTRVLLLSVDGLRPDQTGITALHGTHYPNAYTAIPATRLLFSILWGGDPEHYSLGHVFPSVEEFAGEHPFQLLEAAKAKGWKTRFYIDDGGTIGVAGRTAVLDEVGMPARGWENFINSNLSGHFPLYSAWLDALRVFPGTHPWASMDGGLCKALEAGRGADIVMFHSCLAHTPIFLNRAELSQIPRWWTMTPIDFLSLGGLGAVTPKLVKNWDPRQDPYRIYEIRMQSILSAWEGPWNRLGQDPDYKASTRFFFSDHGERFYHATEEIRMGGVHGFDVDPWNARVPLIVAGPGFTDTKGTPDAVSLLGIRDAVAELIKSDRPIRPDSLTRLPFAPIRYHTLATDWLRPSGKKYREITAEKLILSMKIAPDGIWMMTYDRPAAERGQEATLAKGIGARLIVCKPLLNGGAHRLVYDGYQLTTEEEISEEDFQKFKAEVETVYFKTPYS